MHAEDERLAQIVRLIRRQKHWTQVQLAGAAGVPLNNLKALEAGEGHRIQLGRIRCVLEALDGRARLVPWWNGAAADRLLDERHAALVEHCAGVFRARGWRVEIEVSFSEFGERGSIDILGYQETARAVAVCEVKSVLGSLEETNRVFDAKERLAPAVVHKRLGWRPAVLGRILIVPRTSAIRRVIDVHQMTMTSIYPARSHEIRAWLRSPDLPIRGIWFVADG